MPNGFETYYAAYNTGITNRSFKVSLSSAVAGRFFPQPPGRQDFTLFKQIKDDYEAARLDEVTIIDNIDFRKVGFPCDPSLADEEDITDTDFSKGAVRLELISPEEAFGHQLYITKFPETIIHNSKFYHRKLPL